MKKKLLVTVLILIVFIVGTLVNKKLILLNEFGTMQMRNLNFTSLDEVNFSSVCGLDYAEGSDLNRLNHNQFKSGAVGISYDCIKAEYRRLIGIENINVPENCELIKLASDYYQSDSTYLDVLFFSNEDEVVHAISYRKTKSIECAMPDSSEFMMWRDDRVQIVNHKLEVSNCEMMNEHCF